MVMGMKVNEVTVVMICKTLLIVPMKIVHVTYMVLAVESRPSVVTVSKVGMVLTAPY